MKDDDWTLLDRQALELLDWRYPVMLRSTLQKKRPQRVLWQLFPACMKSRRPQTKFTWWGDCLTCGWRKAHQQRNILMNSIQSQPSWVQLESNLMMRYEHWYFCLPYQKVEMLLSQLWVAHREATSWNLMMFVIWFSVRRSDGENRVNVQPLQYCIQRQEGEIQPEKIDVVNQRTGGPNPEIIKVPTTRRLSSVGIVGRPGTTKTSARVHWRSRRQRRKQMLLPPQEKMMRWYAP